MTQFKDGVYLDLIESKKPKKDKITAYLLLYCLTACLQTFIFGYNIGSTNLPTPLIKEFYSKRYFKEDYHDQLEIFLRQENEFNKTKNLESLAYNFSTQNQIEIFFLENQNKLDVTRAKLNETYTKINSINRLLWTLTTSSFVIGNIFGTLICKTVLDKFGRRKAIMFDNMFSIAAAILVFVSPYFNSPECVIVARFIYGIHGGLMCGLIPLYLNEISPNSLRGKTGALYGLFISIGVFTGQLFGFRQILGKKDTWNFLLSVQIIPSLVFSVSFFLYFPETPKALLLNNRDEESTKKVLRKLRNKEDIDDEINKIKEEAKHFRTEQILSIKELIKSKEFRWPLLIGILLQATLQLCGSNAIYYYSEGIFRRANIKTEHIQYAVVSTGLVSVLTGLVSVQLIGKLGRKTLLVLTLSIMIIDFILLTTFLVFQKRNNIFSYLSIICLIVFFICFSIGIGPLPSIVNAESFNQNTRGTAFTICNLGNSFSNLFLSLTFQYLAELLKNFVFLVFVVLISFSLLVIIIKMPETKGKSVQEILEHYNGPKIEESIGKLLETNIDKN